MTEILNSSKDPKDWEQAADYISTLMDEFVRTSPEVEALNNLKDAINEASRAWNSERMLYTYAQLDAAALIAFVVEKPSIWQTIFNAKACLGPVEDLQAIYQAGLDQGIKFNLEEALRFASTVTSFCPGLKSFGCYPAVEQLFLWGANANTVSNSEYIFSRAVKECGADMGKLYARYGFSSPAMISLRDAAQKAGDMLLYRKFREIYWEYGRYSAIDSQTLVESKDIDPAKNSQLKIIFNFSCSRVKEVYEWTNNARQPIVNEYTFDEYGPVAIETARQKLIELGGNPSDGMVRLMKKSPLTNHLKK